MTLEEYIFLFNLAQKIFAFNRYSFEKFVDGLKSGVKFVFQIDNDADGIVDDEEIFYLDTFFPLSLDNGFTLVNQGEELGLGYPAYRFVSSCDVFPVLQDADIILSGDSICLDLDGDGASDEVIRPVPYDGDGDGTDDFEIIVDDDDNGIPDVSPFSPFYPIGSDDFQDIIEQHSDNVPALDKSFHNYTVSEALLFLIAFCAVIGVISKIIRRRKL